MSEAIVQRADCKPRRHRPDRLAHRSQHPFPQIHPVWLSPTPAHRRLRTLPDSYESQRAAAPEPPLRDSTQTYSGLIGSIELRSVRLALRHIEQGEKGKIAS